MTACAAIQSRRDLILSLFSELDASGVRYVALHSYEALPDDLPSDLDLAVHPDDAVRLRDVLGALGRQGFTAVQCIHYAVNGYYFVFLWPGPDGLLSLAIDFTFHHREGGLILMSGRELVADRRRRDMFWIPRADTEFGYLLGKKTLKGKLLERQAERLRQLVAEIGRPAAEAVAARWFGARWKSEVVDACISGDMAAQIGDMRRRFWRATLRRDPLNPLRHRLTEIPRVWRRWFRPVGVSIAVLGPDGSGKSTLVRETMRQIEPAFRSTRLFHWRPFVLPGKMRTSVQSPHEHGVDGAPRSVVRLMGHLVDYWLGTLLRVRPNVARAGLVVFDRYFEDMLADPRRYRYGGPMWLVELAGRLVPKPDLVLLLDAPEETVLGRKQEVALEEVRRQRQVYLRLASAFSRSFVLDAGAPAHVVAGRACAIVTRFMASRLGQHASRFGFGDGPGDGANTLTQALDRLSGPHSAGDRTHSFGILPSRRNPRFLLPLGNTRAALASLEIYVPFQRRARALKSMLARVVSTGSNLWVRDRVELAAGRLSDLESFVQRVTGESQPVFALSLGTAPRVRKLTVQAMRPQGEILGYIKLPMTGEATARVRHEAAVLDQLRRFSQLRQDIPEPLFAGEWNGSYVLFQSAGAGAPGPTRFNGAHSQFLDNLRRASAIERTGDGLIDEIAVHWDRAAAALDPAWRELGRNALRTASHELRGAAISCGISHGDFAPWNTRMRGDRLFVFDWESAEWDMPVWWDMFHFDIQVASLLARDSGIDLERIDAPAWNGLYLLYLLRSVSRSVEDGSGADALAFRKQRLADLLARQPKLNTLEAMHVGGRY